MKTLSDHVLDIVQNSIRANATLIEVIVEEDKNNNLYMLQISDNGCGMSKEMVEKATNPFFTTRDTRKVGLGLPLLKQNAEMANGKFKLISEVNEGTLVEASFQHSNIDRPELGDIWNTLYLTMLGNKNLELIYQHRTNNGSFKFSSTEIKSNIEGVSMQQAEVRRAILEFIQNNINDIQ